MDSQTAIITVTLHQPSHNIPCGSFIAENQAKFIIFYLFIYLFIYLSFIYFVVGEIQAVKRKSIVNWLRYVWVLISIDKVK